MPNPIVAALMKPVMGILDKVIPDVNERRKQAEALEQVLITVAHEQDAQQNAINLEQAKHDSLFVAGPRPFIMWVCGFGLAYSAIGQPILQDILTSIYQESAPTLTPVNQEILMPITISLLGIGGARTFEKYKGVSRETMRLKRGFFSRFRKK